MGPSMERMRVKRMRGPWMTGEWHKQLKEGAWESGQHRRLNVFVRWRKCVSPSNTRFLVPSPRSIPDDSPIASAFVPKYTLVTNGQTDRQNDDGTRPARTGRLYALGSFNNYVTTQGERGPLGVTVGEREEGVRSVHMQWLLQNIWLQPGFN